MADLDDLCAARARVRADPLPGTALHVQRLLLVEHQVPWPFHALESEGLDPDVVARLVEATREAGGRTVLIRRPGRRGDAEGPRAWAVVDVPAGRLRWGTWTEPADLLDSCPVLREPADHDGWTDEPAVLVCAHGRHDTCCAVRGRPVAAALAERFGDAVWECSHVGGDRFAANVVVVPDTTYYGGLDESTSLDVIDEHLAGRVTPWALRGSSAMPPVAQAAAVAVHERWGPAGPRDVQCVEVTALADDRWRVRLGCDGPLPARVVADVRAVQREAAVLTCQAPRATSARAFVVDALEPDGR